MRKVCLEKRILRIFCILLFFVALIASGSMAAENKFRFVIGSAAPGSSGYIHWEACAYIANKYSQNLECSSISTGGSTESVVLLNGGKVQLSHGTGLEIVSAWAGKEPFKEKMHPWQVFSWTVWALPMVTLADSELKTYYDLKGKSVSLIKKGSGTESMYRIIMEEYGLLDKIKKNYLSFRDSKDALIDGLIVAFPGNFPGGKQHPIMIELNERKPYKPLELDLEVMKRVNERNKGMFVTILPEGAYEGLTEDVPAPGLSGIGLSSADVPDEVIYEFLKAVLGHTDELHSISTVSGATTLENATKWLIPGYPVHPGAARFFKDKGIWREDLIIGER
jgi:TRAP transporter TAXI family solute receptor